MSAAGKTKTCSFGLAGTPVRQMRAALFLVRDGEINVEENYVHRVEDVEFVDGIFTLCKAAKNAGLAIVVVTNQAGIGRGYYTETQFRTLSARMLINAAGLHAPRVAACFDEFPASHIPKAKFAKGSYFSLAGKAPFSHLVYPVPEPGGLGVHLTLDLGSQARFGPDVEWVDEIDYAVDPKRSHAFYSEIRKYWPALQDNTLFPAYAGIRPKMVGEGEGNADFLVQGPADHNIDGLVNLFGIESPGLTASLAIAADVSEIAIANQ